MGESEPGTVARPSPEGDGREGGKTAPGDTTGGRGQLDSASGGYGSESGMATSSGTGESEPRAEEGTGPDAPGATGETPTDWLRSAKPGA